MAEHRVCDACGQELRFAASAYRKAAVRETEAPAKPATRRVVLEVEHVEAEHDSTGWGAGAFGFWALTVVLAATAQSVQSAPTLIVATGSAVTAAICLAGYLRCRMTVWAWRDQKRERLGNEATRRV